MWCNEGLLSSYVLVSECQTDPEEQVRIVIERFFKQIRKGGLLYAQIANLIHKPTYVRTYIVCVKDLRTTSPSIKFQ